MDRELLAGLYEQYSREIFLYLYSMCRSSQTAEDLMQECFLRAILALPDEHGNLRAWLYRVARNLLFDDLRRKKSRSELSDPEQAAERSDDPLRLYLESERRLALFRAISRLEPRRREVLLLQYFSGLSQKQIAQMLDLSHENVRVLSLRARRALKETLKEDGYDLS